MDYFPQSQAHLPAEQRDRYAAVETKAGLKGTANGRTVRVGYRLIFVWSEAKARQEAATRERHTSKIREEFAAVERNLNKYGLTTQEKTVQHRLNTEIPKPLYSDEEVVSYVRTCNSRQAPMTFNVGIHQDGTMAPASVEQLRRLGAALGEKDKV